MGFLGHIVPAHGFELPTTSIIRAAWHEGSIFDEPKQPSRLQHFWDFVRPLFTWEFVRAILQAFGVMFIAFMLIVAFK